MIPLKATDLVYSTEWPGWIIIHHLNDYGKINPSLEFDTDKTQITTIQNLSYGELHQRNFNCHFVVELQGTDYQVIVTQPLLTKCFYPDIDPFFESAIHIGLLGNYDMDLPPTRLYRVLSYKVLAPMCRLFYLDEDRIVLHREISNNDSETCPGEFFDKSILFNQFRSVMKRVSIRKGHR